MNNKKHDFYFLQRVLTKQFNMSLQSIQLQGPTKYSNKLLKEQNTLGSL